MPTVDSKGRIVLPKAVRERLGIDPGTEVDVHEEDGTLVVKPEDDPERILERMDRLVAETAPSPGGSGGPDQADTEVDPIARKHREAVRRGADSTADE